ncbi:hypothetical protein BDN67DRAFT_364184 [Paxillus ammoniavirescens]|nr:hypothetical protein BDN67DRAFT_364184 [Paxillus ammoniavirescens]
MYSVTSSVGGGALSTAGTSPAPSPRAPSFSMKSFVSGIKNSLTNDSASGSGGERASVAGEESEQYIFVEGDGPDEGADQGMGDETLIEPYPFDSASVSTHQSHTTRAQYASGQGQPQTPRTQVHPQIQVQRTQSDSGPIPFPTSTTTPSRMPSPLVHSASLPIPTPPRGYSYSNPSASPSPSHSLASANANANRRPGPATVPPRTPPRRIYHVVNASSDSYDGQNYFEPPPAYASPKRNDWTPRKEKEGLHKHGGIGTPLSPNRLVPPTPGDTLSESSGVSSRDDREEGPSIDFDSTHIPETADDVLDISSANSSFYTDNLAHEEPVEMDPAQRSRLLSPTPPLVIDKRLTKLATMPPRISFHQEGSLEDWSESLFSAIGGKAGKRTSIMIGSKGGNAAGVKAERRTTLRPMSPVVTASGSASAAASSSRSLTAPAPSLPDVSLGANISLGAHMRESVVTLDEEEEQEEEFQAEDEEDLQDTPEEGTEQEAEKADEKPAEGEQEGVEEIDDPPFAPSPPILPDVSLGPNVSSLGKDLGGPIPPTSSTSSEPSGRASVDSLPPPPPPKPKPSLSLAPPQINTIPGISVKSPISPLFAAKPHPLPIPIPLAQIRTQLRPAPQKSLQPASSSSPPAFKQPQPQLALQPQSLSQPLPRPQPQPQVSLPITFSQTSSQRTSSQSLCTTESRPASSQTLLPVRSSPGDRDSGMSTMTVTPATITTAKTEVVRRAVASVVDSDVVSLASRRESMASTAETETQQVEETPDDSLVSESSSASLLRGSPRSPTWPSPPPAPVELDTDTTPRPPRFRTTSLGRLRHAPKLRNGVQLDE